MKVKALIFDLDGTILDTKSLILEALDSTFKILNIKIAKPDFEKYLYFSSMNDYLQVVIDETEHQKINLIKNIYINYYNKNCVGRAKLFCGIDRLLENLNKDYLLLVATSKFTECAKKELKENDLDKHFQYIQGSDPNIPHKPDPYILNMFSKKYSLEPQEIIMIGDTGNDILFGKNFGTHTIAVSYGIWNRDAFKKQGITPDHFVDTVEDISSKIYLINSEISKRL